MKNLIIIILLFVTTIGVAQKTEEVSISSINFNKTYPTLNNLYEEQKKEAQRKKDIEIKEIKSLIAKMIVSVNNGNVKGTFPSLLSKNIIDGSWWITQYSFTILSYTSNYYGSIEGEIYTDRIEFEYISSAMDEVKGSLIFETKKITFNY